MRASVIIPVRNGERYLKACVDSVLAQTMGDFELILVDDGSTDGTASILDGYAAADPRVRVLHEPSTDAGTCRNRGLETASGDVLFFLDADDVFASVLLESMTDGLEDSGADIALCRKVQFVDGNPVPQMERDSELRWQLREIGDPGCDVFAGVTSCAWDKAFSRAFIARRGLRFLDSPSSNDFTFVIAAVSAADRIASTDCALVAHRYHAASVQATRGKSVRCFFNAVEACVSEMTRLGVPSARPWVWNRFREYYFEHLFWQLGTMRTREAFDELRLCARESERRLEIVRGERPRSLLGRRRLRRYAAWVTGARWESLQAWLERLLVPWTGDYELHAGWRRLAKRGMRWAIAALFDPLLLPAKIERRA